MKSFFKISLLILFTGVYAKGQDAHNYSLRFYNQFDGLHSQTVNAIHADNNGCLIIGTDNGVYLFNGQTFSKPIYSDKIQSIRIEGIQAIDQKSYLLFGGTPNRLYMVSNNKVVWTEDVSGGRNIEHLVCYNPKTKLIYRKDEKAILSKTADIKAPYKMLLKTSNPLISFTNDFEGNIYYWSDNTLFYFSNGITKPIYSPVKKDLIWHYHKADNNQIIAWGQDTVFTFYKGKCLSKIKNETPANTVVRKTSQLNDGTIWFTNNGSVLRKLNNDVVEDFALQFGLYRIATTSVYLDKNGEYWVGTIGKGLARVVKATSYIVKGSEDLKITTIASDSENILIGSINGIFSVIKDSIARLSPVTDYPTSLANVFTKNYTHSLSFQDEKWLISSMITNKNQLKKYQYTNILKRDAIVKNGPSMHLQDKTVFFGFWGSFSYLKFNEGIEQKTTIKPNKGLGRTNSFYSINDGLIAISDERIYYLNETFDNKYDTTLLLNKKQFDKAVLFKKLIRQNDNFLLSTSAGVYRLNFDSLKKQLTVKEQIFFAESNDILNLDNNNLLIGTSMGLVNYANKQFNTIPISQNNKSPKINCLYHDKKHNSILIGTENGLYAMSNKLNKNVDALFALTSYEFSGFENDTNFTEKILDPNNKNFTIEANFTSFKSAAAPTLYYSLNNGPTVATNSNQANFTSLEPNNYIIKIWGQTLDGRKTKTKAFTIIIKTPFWKKPSVLISFSVFILLLSWLIFKLILIRQKRRNEKSQQMQLKIIELEKKALNLSLNPHFIFNSLNSIQSEISSFKNEKLINYIADFAQLMRTTLENSDEKSIGLDEELEHLERYIKMEQLRFEDAFTYEIKIPDTVLEKEYEVPPMLLQPFVENSILHGILTKKTGKGHIVISVEDNADFLKICIRDNGIGFLENKNTANHESKGISISKKRVQLLNPLNSIVIKSIIENKTVQGVDVTITLYF